MDIKTILFQWRFVIVVVIAILIAIVAHWHNFKSKAYALMLQAEKIAKSDARTLVLTAGPDKEAWVVQKLCLLFPVITVFVPQALMQGIVHYLFLQAKDLLDDGELNNSFNNGGTPNVEPIKPLPNILDPSILSNNISPADNPPAPADNPTPIDIPPVPADIPAPIDIPPAPADASAYIPPAPVDTNIDSSITSPATNG